MKSILPYLWFNNQAEAAVDFYTAIFPDSKINSVSLYRSDGAEASGQPEGSVMSISFDLAGLSMVALNGGPYYNFTPAVSFFVNCSTAEELDRIWTSLSAGGSVLMELGSYPFSERYGWLADQYGVSWQLMLSSESQMIVPSLMFSGDRYGQAEPAINLYTAAIPGSAIRVLERQPDGKVLYSSFMLHGQLFTAMENDFEHGFTFTPAISFLLECESQEEVDRLWDEMTAGGEIVQCGWIVDRFGVSWQIVPAELFTLLQDEDAEKAARVMQAMLQMKKIDVAALRAAAAGKS